MTVTINTFDQRSPGGSWQKVDTLTHSTATALQSLDLQAGVSVLGGTTATVGLTNGLYTLADGVEGQEKTIIMDATGQAVVLLENQLSGRMKFDVSSVVLGGTATSVDTAWASATGRYVFQSGGDYIRCRFQNGAWVVFEANGATLSTGT